MSTNPPKADDGNGRRLNELIDKIVSVGSAALVAQLGADTERARDLMRDVAHDVCAEVGGGPIYVGKDVRFGESKRNSEIFRKWRSGALVVELARDHGLTTARVYHIIKLERDADRAKRQGQLPGFT